MNMKGKIAFVGFGKMAQAIAGGLIQNKVKSASQILAYDLDQKSLSNNSRRLKIKPCENNIALIQNAEIVILAVKPFHLGEVLTEIAPYIKRGQIFISIAAGAPLKALKKYTETPFWVRVMPNTPALLKLGMTGIYFDHFFPKNKKKNIEKIFQALGKTLVVSDEKSIDAVTALSGSGPAFVYAFADAMIQGGIKAGLNKSDALLLSIQTLKGASAMLEAYPDPENLIAQVSSKKGTTLEGLKTLKKYKFKEIVKRCVQSAHKRSQSISKEF